ncbi:MAG: GAF and ANTAR domain-containing protein, partial [Pseudonocardia sediminis]
RSMHALPLRRRGRVIGVLVLSDATPGPLSHPDLVLGQALADTAAVAILRDREVRRVQGVAAQLQGALDGRVAVEQAKGFVAQHHGVDVDTAFRLLRELAWVLRLQLPDVARLVVAGEVVPGGPATSPDA